MKTLNPPCDVIHRRLSVRGFRTLTVDQACSVETWMRLNPALNALLFGLCGVTGSVPGLLVLAAFFLIGMLTAVHPFELFYTEIIRSLEQTPELPSSPPLRRVVFGIGATGSLTAAWGFYAGHQWLAYAIQYAHGVLHLVATRISPQPGRAQRGWKDGYRRHLFVAFDSPLELVPHGSLHLSVGRIQIADAMGLN